MKKLLLLTSLVVFSCIGKKETFDLKRKVPAQKLTPPGTVWLRDNLFIDETEITNFSYQEFLFWLKQRKDARYYLMLPDTNCWTRSDIGSADKLIAAYFTLKYYYDYPVVGVSMAQAEEFCRWRTDMVNAFYYVKEKKQRYNHDSESVYFQKASKKVLYRLPAQNEWEYAAAAGLDYCNFPMGYESLTHNNIPVNNTLEYHNYYVKDFKTIDKKCDNPIEVGCPTIPVYAGKANRYGLYQVIGNVSELTSDSLVKGFNYSLPLFSIERSETEKGSFTMNSLTYSYELNKKYKRPEPWIGFRCICEVLEK
jgi:formylglycine-generating enzyme required for sulfatase activity